MAVLGARWDSTGGQKFVVVSCGSLFLFGLEFRGGAFLRGWLAGDNTHDRHDETHWWDGTGGREGLILSLCMITGYSSLGHACKLWGCVVSGRDSKQAGRQAGRQAGSMVVVVY